MCEFNYPKVYHLILTKSESTCGTSLQVALQLVSESIDVCGEESVLSNNLLTNRGEVSTTGECIIPDVRENECCDCEVSNRDLLTSDEGLSVLLELLLEVGAESLDVTLIGGNALFLVELFLVHDWHLDGVELANEVVNVVGK